MAIRLATIEDIPAMHDCHDAAIRERAAAFYSPEIIHMWQSHNKPEYIARDADLFANPDWVMLVFEQDGVIYGMGMANPVERHLRAIYVMSGSGQPAGSLLLEDIVQACRARECPYLDFDASVNARDFYERHGAVTLEESIHMMGGIPMACLKMRLVL